MKVRIFGHSGEPEFPYGETGPWLEFKNTILDLNFELVEGNLNLAAEAVIAHSHNKQIENYMKKHNIPIKFRALVIWEPFVVDSQLYDRSVLELYGAIFAPSKKWAKQTRATYFHWPQNSIELGHLSFDTKSRKKRAILVQGNKFSARKGEMYSLRREILIKDKDRVIDLYGTDWNRGLIFDLSHWVNSLRNTPFKHLKFESLRYLGRKYASYKGSVVDKEAALRNYKFTIVIENSGDFVSEKLFDAVRAGCLVIYVGPNLNDYGINAEYFVTVEPDAQLIYEALRELMLLSEIELNDKIKKQINELIRVNPEWKNSLVLKNLATQILKKFEYFF